MDSLHQTIKTFAVAGTVQHIESDIIALKKEVRNAKFTIKSIEKEIAATKARKPVVSPLIMDAAMFKKEYKFTAKQIEVIEALTGKSIKTVIDRDKYRKIELKQLKYRKACEVEKQSIRKRKIGMLVKLLYIAKFLPTMPI